MDHSSPDYILCADWAVRLSGRAVYLADVRNRELRCAGRTPASTVDGAPWTAREVLGAAALLRRSGAKVLVAFDVPFGVPESFLRAVSGDRGGGQSFIEWVVRACSKPGFGEPVTRAVDWTPDSPFFAVPRGAGGLTGFLKTAAAQGVALRRRIDVLTGARPIFARSGIPGTVGSGAVSLWRELAPSLEGERDYCVWPFEGPLEALLESRGLVIGETYPRAAYAISLDGAPPEFRARRFVAKTNPCCRASAVRALIGSEWIRRTRLRFFDSDFEHVLLSEDAFDAFMTAASLMRCALEGTRMSKDEDAFAEGGILCSGSINLELPEKRFMCDDPDHGR